MPPFAETERLIFRPYREADQPQLFRHMGDMRVRHYEPEPFAPNQPSFAERVEGLLKSATIWLIVESKGPPAEGKGVRAADDPGDDDRFVGQVMLHGGGKNRAGKMGIAIDPRWWGQGIGTEAVRWIVDFGFEQFGFHRIGLDTIGSNASALGAYKKAGFVEEGRERESIWIHNGWHDIVSMGVLRREWEAARATQKI